MYTEYFGLSAKPFSIAPNPRYLYLSPQHQDALAHLLYGVDGESGGFVLLSGEVGTGKTTLCRHLLGHLPEDTDVALLLNPMLSSNELLATICDELNISYPKSSADKYLIDAINHYLLDAHSRGRDTLLIIDEAQNLSFGIMEQVRMLTNLETDDKKLLRIILVGQPELLDKLADRRMRQLAQRITARYHLRALPRHAVEEYVQFRLDACGVKTALFTPVALRVLWWKTRGIPRLINIICDRALLGAYAANERQVGARHIWQAAREISGPRRLRLPRFSLRTQLVSYTLVLMLALISILGWSGGRLNIDLEFGADRLATTQRESGHVATPNAGDSAVTDTEDDLNPDFPLPVAVASGATPATYTDNALAVLFSRWDLNYIPSRDGDYCLYAIRSKLQCFKGRTTVENLLNYNRPTLLHEVLGNDKTYYDVVLVGVEDDMLVLAVGADVQRVPKDVFHNYWNGRFTLLWRPPEAYSLPLREGDSGPLVTWLAHRRAQLEGGSVVAHWTLDGELLDWLKEFQRKTRIPVNGVINPETVILVANLTQASVPRLTG